MGSPPTPTAVIEHWDGTSWNVVPSPNPNPQGNNGLGAVAAISATDIWAAGHQLLGPFTEHWDGTSSSIVATPQRRHFIAGMAASSAGTVLAVGQGNGWERDHPVELTARLIRAAEGREL